MNVLSTTETMVVVDEFTVELAEDRDASYDTLLHKGRRVTDVEARIVEAQFRRPDGSTLVLLNDDKEFKELLTILLVGPGLKVIDQIRVGGAFTPGYLTYAYPISEDEVAFCWHDLDQVVLVHQHRPALGLRQRWLSVREVVTPMIPNPRAPLPTLRSLLPSVSAMRSFVMKRWL